MTIWNWLWAKLTGTERQLEAYVAGPSAPPARPAPPARAASAPSPHVQSPPRPEAARPPQPPAYGIENAIQLMRALPLEDDPDLVLRVVRKTLRSMGISVEEIIGAAKTREDALAESITNDREAIEQFQRDIAARNTKIDATVKQMVETRKVRACLQEAIENESKVGIVVMPEAIAHTPPPPPPSTVPVIVPARMTKPPIPKPATTPPIPKPATTPPIPKPATSSTSLPVLSDPGPHSEPTVKRAAVVPDSTPPTRKE